MTLWGGRVEGRLAPEVWDFLRADDAACQAVLQAVIKQSSVPVHQKVTVESAAAPGKPMQNEMMS